MSRHFAASLIAVLMLASSALAADFYVATDGRDSWSGKLPAPNANASDGPFASVARAQQAARQSRQPGKSLTVAIRGGTYFLDKPIEFTPADSGSPNAPVAYVAYEGEHPVFSGGIILTGWKEDAQGRWYVQLPDVQSGQWNFVQLFADGQRRYRPRLPTNDWYTIADKLDPTPKNAKRGFDRFKFSPGQIKADWANLADIEVLPVHTWTMSRFRIESVDEAENTVTFTGVTRGLQWWSSLPKGNRFLVENVKEALAQPGQWYLDRPSGVLTYIPMPGERPSRTQMVAPRTDMLVRIQGDVAGKKWVEHLHLRGLTFAYTNWVTPPEGNSYPQAEVNLGGAVAANGARDLVIADCTVRSVATYALDIAQACQRVTVERCEMTDMGAGGIKIGTTRLEQDEDLLTTHVTVRDCLMAHGGRLHPAAVGVWIGHAAHNTIEHNEIADFYYTGVSIGWTWGYRDSGAHHNVVAYNRIHNLGQAVLSDMGGIYTLGPSPGSMLHHNLIYNVDAFSYGGWGIYYDEGTTGMVAENNIVHHVKTGGFHQHYGKENVFRNNIIAFSRLNQVERTRPEEHLSFTFERNIVYFNSGALLGMNWTGSNFGMKSNLYWRADGKPIEFSKMNWDQWREKGHDKDSLIADPMFVDPDNADFRLKPGSPAEKVGFKPIDTSRIGRLTRKAGQSPVSLAPPAFPLRPAP